MANRFPQPRLLKGPNQPNLEQELLTDDQFQLQNSVVSTIEGICLFALTTALRTESSGRSTSCPSITITTSPFSLRESARSKTHIGSFPYRESSICLKRVAQKCFQLSHNWSFLSRVSYIFNFDCTFLFSLAQWITWLLLAALNTRDIEIVCVTLKIL